MSVILLVASLALRLGCPSMVGSNGVAIQWFLAPCEMVGVGTVESESRTHQISVKVSLQVLRGGAET